MALTQFPYNLYGIFLCLLAFGLLTLSLIHIYVIPEKPLKDWTEDKSLLDWLNGLKPVSYTHLNPLTSFQSLGERWGHSKTTISRILKKFEELNFCLLYTSRCV